MSRPPAEARSATLAPLLWDPSRAAVLCDIDGTIAPIVQRPQDSRVPEGTLRLLGRLARRFGCVACVSGRSVAEARRLVGVGGIAYVGSHGAEVLHAGQRRPAATGAFSSWEPRVAAFVVGRAESHEAKQLRIRLEDKGPIKALHWRGAPDEDAAETHLQGIAQEAEAAGLAIHWGRKVLEIRPPVAIDKGQGVRAVIERSRVSAALYAGDDVTDLDAFDALDALLGDGALSAAVRVGVRSQEGPVEIVERADLVVDGVAGFATVLAELAGDG